MNDEIICLSQMTALPGKEGELQSALEALIEPSRKEPGCVAYELWVSSSNPRSFLMYERFKNKQTLDQHLQMLHVQHFMKSQYTTCVESHWDLDLNLS